MRQLILLLIISVFYFFQGNSQNLSQRYVNYEAVILGEDQQPLINKTVGVQVTLLPASVDSQAVYVERHTVMTNGNGLLSLQIGSGTAVMGEYLKILWSLAPTYFVKIEIDQTGGTDYSITETRELSHVPLAIYAFSANERDPAYDTSVAGGITASDTMSWNSKVSGTSVAGGIMASDTMSWNRKVDKASVAGGITASDTMSWNSKVAGASVAGGITASDTMSWNRKVDRSSVAGGITSLDTARWNKMQNILIAGDNLEIVDDTIRLKTALVDTSHYIGKFYGGGIIVWLDTSGSHGLIMALEDLSPDFKQWSNIDTTEVGNTSLYRGDSNTVAIMNQAGHTNSAAKNCSEYVNSDFGTGIYEDWYLPSVLELVDMFTNYYIIAKNIEGDNNSSTTILDDTELYWTSTEAQADKAIAIASYGFYFNRSKAFNHPSRPFRKF